MTDPQPAPPQSAARHGPLQGSPLQDGPLQDGALLPAAAPPVPVRFVEAKATALLLLLLLLVGAAIAYVMYARGVFEAHQRLVLVADDSEGVVVGMDLTFSGFPVGRVRAIELSPEGNARIVIDVPRRDAKWLRTSSVFTLVRGMLGNTNLRAYSGQLIDPPLPDGAERKVLVGDATAEIPKLVAAAKDLVQNLRTLTATDGPLSGSLRNVQTATDILAGKRGALGLLLGNEADANRLLGTLDRTNAMLTAATGLLGKADALTGKVDAIAGKADAQVFGPDGLLRDTRATVQQLNAMLGEARLSLKRVDGLLAEAQGIAANARIATTDLGALRTEVDASLRKVQQLVDEINRKWPFARDTEVKLP